MGQLEKKSVNQELLKTALWDLHVKNNGKMVEFAGYELPVQYDNGVKSEHLHVREKAGLFDVSHMGQIVITSANDKDPAYALETIVPSDIKNLAVGKMRYTVLLNEDGGILDDLIITRLGDDKFYAVLNASRKEDDIEYMLEKIGHEINIKQLEDKALLAVQGPKAEKIIGETLLSNVSDLGYMTAEYTDYKGEEILVTRSGYTGEDGFEISVPEDLAAQLATELLQDDDLWLIGLGARDSLRLEAGFCLYGHDIDENTTPIEAGIGWTIQKRRRQEGGFLGFDKITKQINSKEFKKRIGLRPEGRAPIREGVEVFDSENTDIKIGVVTSGGYSPILESPIAMGYIEHGYYKTGSKVIAKMRGKDYPCTIVKMPFINKD